ncbi:uncharacterized protein N7459_007500 [Penicillium hispanicum]|uniref:uncharacterized protein n=1 Tax=Penicillium hispanicum TaxID=1080232 RepID=UPI002540E84C|nr:uncharacterized protein N7459_007500 [Penicillium hispanicum]KAJ5578536.1 hypothetical protein N7459_007500 [Penicillium hispanicum]
MRTLISRSLTSRALPKLWRGNQVLPSTTLERSAHNSYGYIRTGFDHLRDFRIYQSVSLYDETLSDKVGRLFERIPWCLRHGVQKSSNNAGYVRLIQRSMCRLLFGI